MQRRDPMPAHSAPEEAGAPMVGADLDAAGDCDVKWPAAVPFGAVSIHVTFCPGHDFDGETIGDYKIRHGVPVCRIWDELAEGLRDVTVAHELAHGWLDLSGIEMDEKTLEATCEAVGHGVVQLLAAMGEK